MKISFLAIGGPVNPQRADYVVRTCSLAMIAVLANAFVASAQSTRSPVPYRTGSDHASRALASPGGTPLHPLQRLRSLWDVGASAKTNAKTGSSPNAYTSWSPSEERSAFARGVARRSTQRLTQLAATTSQTVESDTDANQHTAETSRPLSHVSYWDWEDQPIGTGVQPHVLSPVTSPPSVALSEYGKDTPNIEAARDDDTFATGDWRDVELLTNPADTRSISGEEEWTHRPQPPEDLKRQVAQLQAASRRAAYDAAVRDRAAPANLRGFDVPEEVIPGSLQATPLVTSATAVPDLPRRSRRAIPAERLDVSRSPVLPQQNSSVQQAGLFRHQHPIQSGHLPAPEYQFHRPSCDCDPPVGSSLANYMNAQIANGTRGRLYLYDYDFQPSDSPQRTELNAAGRRKLARLVPLLGTTGHPLVVVTSPRDLADSRRANVLLTLNDQFGLAIGDSQVVVGDDPRTGLRGLEAVEIDRNQLQTTRAQGTTATGLSSQRTNANTSAGAGGNSSAVRR